MTIKNTIEECFYTVGAIALLIFALLISPITNWQDRKEKKKPDPNPGVIWEV